VIQQFKDPALSLSPVIQQFKDPALSLSPVIQQLFNFSGHGHCIVQCKTAKIVTTKTIPVQVDGEAVRSVIIKDDIYNPTLYFVT
jgi:hypothetical protein